MIKEDSEKRMMVLVPYNLSPIQQGIQTAHAIAELGYKMHFNNVWKNGGVDFSIMKYNDWVLNWKTIIVLNGGTTNNNSNDKWYGSLQKHRDKLKELGVIYSEFYEPDLNNTLTAVAFIVDMEKDWMVLKYLENLELA